MKNKYPYVEKEYYPAVMFACKMIRENGYFNKAIKISASYYGVDEEKLKKYVNERRAAGQRGKSRGEFKFYAVLGYVDMVYNDDEGTHESIYYRNAKEWVEAGRKVIVKALNYENALSKILSYYPDGHYIAPLLIEEYGTQKEAKERLKKIKKNELIKRLESPTIKEYHYPVRINKDELTEVNG